MQIKVIFLCTYLLKIETLITYLQMITHISSHLWGTIWLFASEWKCGSGPFKLHLGVNALLGSYCFQSGKSAFGLWALLSYVVILLRASLRFSFIDLCIDKVSKKWNDYLFWIEYSNTRSKWIKVMEVELLQCWEGFK